MTRTELTAHRIMDAWQHRGWDACIRCQTQLHPCATKGCTTRVLGSRFCARCEEERGGIPYTFAGVLTDMPRYVRYLFWTLAVVVFASAVLLAIAQMR